MNHSWLTLLTRRTFLPTLATASLLLAMAIKAGAQSSLTAWMIDSGGGRSTGGVHTVTGSLGQPVGGRQTSKSFQLVSAFFGLVAAVPVEGSPVLRIVPAAREVVLAWPAKARGFVLEQTPSLTRPAWSLVTTAATVAGQEYQVRLPRQTADRFFRLRKP